jgi:hypothetical protein
MRTRRGLSRVLGLATATVVLLPAIARADGQPKKLWLEARPYTCSEYLAPLARELTLACDAAGGACAVARDEGSADRRLVLHCAEPAWSLEATDAWGASKWSVDLVGGDADRLRSAAVFAVRAESDDRALVRAPASPPASMPAPSEAKPLPEPDRRPRVGEPSDWSLAAAPHAGALVSSAQGIPEATGSLGVGVYVSRRLRSFLPGVDLHVALTGSAERPVTGSNGAALDWQLGAAHAQDVQNATYEPRFTAGGALGIGAPFDHTPFGALAEVGYAWRPGTFGGQEGVQARGEVVYQLFPTAAVRPWLGVSFRRIFDTEKNAVGLDLGIAWDPGRERP